MKARLIPLDTPEGGTQEEIRQERQVVTLCVIARNLNIS